MTTAATAATAASTTKAPPPFGACDKGFLTRLRDAGYDAPVIFDIGGSNGWWSRTMLEVYPESRYELFEPLAGRRKEYDQSLRTALAEQANFRVHSVALGDRDGQADFWNEPSGFGSSLLSSNAPANERITVPVRRLDGLMHELKLPRPQIIKADVQGSEDQIIRGGLNTFAAADILLLETWLRRGYGKATPLLTELIDMLMPLGFLLVDVGDFYRKPDQELISIDAFFAHRRCIEQLTRGGAPLPWRSAWEG